MSTSAPQPADAPAAFPFTPVPSRKPRHDGWSAQRQRQFITGLAALGSVSGAARVVGSSVAGVYALRKRAGAESFAAAWDAALAEARERRFMVAFDRAINGVTVPRHYRGQFVGTRHFYDNAAGIAALRDPPLPPVRAAKMGKVAKTDEG